MTALQWVGLIVVIVAAVFAVGVLVAANELIDIDQHME